MAHISQHEAAELWEITRDHIGGATRLDWLVQSVQDPQLRQTLQRHAQHFHRAGQTLASMLQNHHGAQQSHQQYQSFGQFQQSPGQLQQFGQHGQQGNSPVQPLDAVVVMGCLADCKSMAVKCTWSATEASQPARNYLHQLAGEHLRMAEEHYHWLEQRGLYAAPKADEQVVHQYSHTLNHIAGAGTQIMQSVNQYQSQTQVPGVSQPNYGTGYGPTGQGSPYQHVSVPGHAGAGSGTVAPNPFERRDNDDPLDPGH